MYLAWLNGQYQILGPSSHKAQIADTTVNAGVKPQQSAIFCEGGPSNRQIDVSHQAPGGNQTGYQRPYFNLQNPSCDVQKGQPFHVTGLKNAVSHSSVQHHSNLRLNTIHYQGRNSQFSLPHKQSSSTMDSNMSSSALQHNMNNEGLHQVFNQGLLKPNLVTFTTAAPLLIRQEVSKTGISSESSSASNKHIDSVNKTQHGLYPSAHTRNFAIQNLNKSAVRLLSTGQSSQVYSLNQPTKDILSTVLGGSKTKAPQAAESRHDIIGTPMQGSTNQQTTTQPGERLVTTRSNDLVKSHPLMSHLLLDPVSVSNSAQSLSTNKRNNSIPARIIAVVQPLSPQCNVITSASKCHSPHNLDLSIVETQNKTTKEDCRNPLQSETQPQSNQCLNMHQSTTKHADDMLSKGQSMHPSTTEHADDMLCKEHCNGTCASQPLTFETPEKKKGVNNEDEMPVVAKASVFELAFLPTIKWTLKELVLLYEGFEMQDVPRNCDLRKQLLVMFWGASFENVACILKTNWFSAWIRYVYSFCANNVREDTIVLSQVYPSFADQRKNFHVLKDGEVYTELPYTSSWLNTNDQLDDIDKEFGPNLSRYMHFNQPDPVERVTNISSQNVSKVPRSYTETGDKDFNGPLANIPSPKVSMVRRPDTERVDRDSNDPLANISLQNVSKVPRPDTEAGDDDCNDTFANISPQNVSDVPKPGTETVDKDCNDYLFEIQVLPPEEAKAIFEQGHVVMSQSTESIGQTQDVPNTFCAVVDEPLKNLHVTSGSKLNTTLNRFCCIAKWKETIFGSKTPLHDKCQCKEELRKFTEKPEQINCTQFTMEPDVQSHSLEGDMKSKSEEKKTSSLPTISWLEICNEISETFELNDDEERNDLHGQQSKRSQTKIKSENKEYVSDCDNITYHIADNEDDFNKAQLKPAESYLSTDSHISDNDSWTKNPIDTIMSLNNEHVDQAPMASSHGTKSSLELEQVQCSAKSGSQTDLGKGTHESDERKRKRLNSPNSIFPYLKKLMRKNLDSHKVDVSKNKVAVGSDGKPLVSGGKTVQLMLFGSLPQEKQTLDNHGNETTKPPQVIFARVDSTKKSCIGESNSIGSATESTLFQTKTKLGTKLKLITDKEKKFRSTNDKNPVGQQSQSVKHDKRKNENGTQDDLPIQENVLTFNILPTSFRFEDESSGRKDGTEHSSDEPSSESERKNPYKKSRVDVWSRFPVKGSFTEGGSSSVHHGPESKSSSVFAEYQKKCIEKSQSSIIQ